MVINTIIKLNLLSFTITKMQEYGRFNRFVFKIYCVQKIGMQFYNLLWDYMLNELAENNIISYDI